MFIRVWSMKLHEIFDLSESVYDITSKDIATIEHLLNDKFFGSKFTIVFPIGTQRNPSHFYKRAWERGVTPKEIINTIVKGFSKFKKEFVAILNDEIEVSDNHRPKYDFYDPETKILIPILVEPNFDCKKHQKGNPVCLTANGTKEPKNKLYAKTIYKKGEDDIRSWDDEPFKKF